MREIKGNCSFCSLACPLVFRGGGRSPVFGEESLLTLDWDASEDSKYGGSLCARGSAAVEFVSHPERLNYPWILGERSVMHAAVSETAKNLIAIKEEFGSDKIGVISNRDEIIRWLDAYVEELRKYRNSLSGAGSELGELLEHAREARERWRREEGW